VTCRCQSAGTSHRIAHGQAMFATIPGKMVYVKRPWVGRREMEEIKLAAER